ncbi:MAG TPA: cytochrome c oxidase subunit II [Gammaproteobacteria bacterium]|nr:cytochrome c oxidase subunit II [Gammaproteobacteria bacterium]
MKRRRLPIVLSFAAVLFLPGAAWADLPMTYLITNGSAANPLAHLGWGLMGLSVFVIVFIALAVLIGIWRGRRSWPMDAAGRPKLLPGVNAAPFVVIGVCVSIVLLFGSAVWTFFTLAHVSQPPKDPAITLDVTAHQWWWEVEYKHYGQKLRTFVTANEIHVPVGEPVRVRLIGTDVIHSFWAPELFGKMDVIPGQTNITWFEAGKAGVYRGQCTEFCGLQHAHMAFHIVAQPPAKFHQWWTHQLADAKQPVSPQAQHGERVFLHHCAICHTVRGAGSPDIVAMGKLGPDLTHLMSRHWLGAGTVPNTTGYLAAWVENAQSIKPGIAMPTMDLTNRQLLDVVAYLQTLN